MRLFSCPARLRLAAAARGTAAAAAARGMAARREAYLSQEAARRLDEELMGASVGFSLDQLMELAGLAVAAAAEQQWPARGRVLLVCGPGNNGGDGLVAARHLFHFGYAPEVVYPRRPARAPFGGLVAQLRALGVPVREEVPPPAEVAAAGYAFAVDAVFGFGFRAGGEVREPFGAALRALDAAPAVLAVDVPSGWDVERGPAGGAGAAAAPTLRPDALVSLSAPKPCSRHFDGAHYVGGRFVPPALAERYGLELPAYPGREQVVLVSRGAGAGGAAAP